MNPRRWFSRWRRTVTDPPSGVQRWVLLDVETGGLDVERDPLLAIAAVAVEVDWPQGRLVIRPGDSLSVTLRPPQASGKANILLHGIGAGRQRAGLPPAEGLQAFLDWAGPAPRVAFHAAFDRALLTRECRRHLGDTMRHEWLDLAPLCTVSHPSVQARALDDWLRHFRIECLARHEAAADVLAEAELLQRIWPRVAAECDGWQALQRYAGRAAWLGAR